MQDLIKLVRNPFLYALLALPLFNAQSSVIIENNSITKALNDGCLKISKAESRLGNNLAKVYEITDKGYINIALTKKVLKSARSFSAFHVYVDWLQSIVDIHSKKNEASLRSSCEKLSKKKHDAYLKMELAKQSLVICFNQYLKLASKKAPKLEKINEQFFYEHAKYLAHPNNKESLSYFLSRFESDSKGLKTYSKILSDHFVASKTTPPKKLLQYMDITPELTRFIQIKGLEDNDSKWVLDAELKKLIAKAYDLANDGAEAKKIRTPLKEALTYYGLSYPHLPKSKADLRLLGLGKSFARRGYFEEARLSYDAIIDKNPTDEDAIFEKMWTWITQNEYKKAYKEVIQKKGLEQNFQTIQDDRLQFWTAYTLREIGNEKARPIFENLISKSALNYYSILASKLLSEHYDIPSEKIYYKLANENTVKLERFPKLDQKTLLSIKRFKIWGDIDFKPLLNLENKNAFRSVNRYAASLDEGKAKEVKSAFILLAASALKEKENYLESFKLIYRGLNKNLISLDESVLHILFPKPYYREVASTIKNDVDPLIAMSLIRQESGFNRKARSWVGARGLMQLMPATARRYWRGIKTSHLYNPNINIKIGSKYLSILLNKYDQNLVYALSAYNAGETRVKRWRREYLNHENTILHNIENIPFLETRKYVKLIFRNLFFYKMMDKKVEVADSEKVNQIFDVKLGFNQK